MKRSPMRGIAALAAALVLVCAGSMSALAAEKVRIALNKAIYTNLPIFLAIEKGYFADEGLDVELIGIPGATSTVIPMLARGDVELAPMSGNPALFNAQAEGFELRLVANLVDAHKGSYDSAWLVVRKELWDSGEIRQLSDIKGYRVDGASKGSIPAFWINQALSKAGLSYDDVQYTERFASPPDWNAAMMNNAVDVIVSVEPIASRMVQGGIAERLAGAGELRSGMQSIFLASSETFAQEHHAELVGALKAILKARREIAAQNSEWTPEFKAVASKYTGMEEAVLDTIPGLVYAGGNGEIDDSSLQLMLEHQRAAGLITGEPDLDKLVDRTALKEAIAALDE